MKQELRVKIDKKLISALTWNKQMKQETKSKNK